MVDRIYGYQFSGIEYYTTFEKEDCGFVRLDGRSKRRFYLDSYPGYSIKKDMYVIVDGEIPETNDLVEITSYDVEKEHIETKNGFEYLTTKYVQKWKKINPQKIINRKPLPSEEFINYFRCPFVSENMDLYDTAKCMAMYAVSSHIKGFDNVGGIHSGTRITEKQANVLNKLLNGIPTEFKKIASDKYYVSIKQNKAPTFQNKSEININYLNPESVFCQIPLYLNLDLKRKSDYFENLEHMEPLIQAQIRDAVLFKPDISDMEKKRLLDYTYEMMEHYKDNSTLGFHLDLSATAAKISTALARTQYDKELSKKVIEDSVQTWIDNFDFVSKRIGSNLNLEEESRLSRPTLMLYGTLEDTHGIDTQIMIEDAQKVSKLNEWEFEAALSELKMKNAIMCPDNYSIRLIDLKLKH